MINSRDEEAVYKYISSKHIKSLFEENHLFFCRIEKWPDMMEQYLDKIVHPKQAAKRFGSCWTLHKGVCRIVGSDSRAEVPDDVKINGVESMWRTYCPNGGVRIRTSLGKIRKAVEEYCNESNAIPMEGPVLYEHYASAKREDIDALCFSKSPSFYTDDEYRFVITTESVGEDFIKVPIGNPANFVEEILVSPPRRDRSSERCVSDGIFDYFFPESVTEKFL